MTLAAEHYDTRDLRLLRWGVTLCRREGGPDPGWHLVIPPDSDDPTERDDVRLELGAGASGDVPDRIVAIVRPLVREAVLSRVAALPTPPPPPDVRVPERPGRRDPASAALHHVIAGQVRGLLLQEVRVRRGLPDSVHQMRVRARTLRSVLRTFRPLLDRRWAKELSDGLKAAATALGGARDLEVQQHHLGRDVRQLPPPYATFVGPVLDRELGRRREVALAEMHAYLDSDAHLRLLIRLVHAAADPQFTPRAARPARAVLQRRIRRAVGSLRDDVDGLGMQSPADQWHRARIRAKRARYAAKVAAPVLGGAARRTARRLAEVTDILGEQQDAQVAGRLIDELASLDDVDPRAGFGLGILHAAQVERARQDREQFLRMWPAVSQALG